MRSYHVKENSIGSTVSKILLYRQTKRHTDRQTNRQTSFYLIIRIHHFYLSMHTILIG